MVSLSCSTTARDGVTLVTAVVRGEGERRRVRLANRLDGPIWPPRCQGVPEAGWDDHGVSVVVPASGRRAVGYASTAPPADPPLELVESVPADGAPEPTAGMPDSTTDALDSAGAVVRDLGDPSPPRDAVPLPDGNGSTGAADHADGPDDAHDADESDGTTDAASGRTRTPDGAPAADDATPEPVAAWLDDVQARIDRAESLAAADSLPAATRALRSVGGLDGAARHAEQCERDAAALREVAERAERLADRAAGAAVPVETLERIA